MYKGEICWLIEKTLKEDLVRKKKMEIAGKLGRSIHGGTHAVYHKVPSDKQCEGTLMTCLLGSRLTSFFMFNGFWTFTWKLQGTGDVFFQQKLAPHILVFEQNVFFFFSGYRFQISNSILELSWSANLSSFVSIICT